MSTPVQSSSRLMVLLFSDIVGSTQLKSDLGTRRYADLLARHDRIFKRLIETTPGAQILKDMGDGYFASFATGSDAVRVALLFQYLMAVEPWGEVRLSTRVGIHLGEIVELDLEVTGKPKVIGLAADLTARVMSLGLGGQILLTRSAFDDARQFVSSHPQVDAALAELSVGPAAGGLRPARPARPHAAMDRARSVRVQGVRRPDGGVRGRRQAAGPAHRAAGRGKGKARGQR